MLEKKRQQNINGISNKETLGKELMNNKAKKKTRKIMRNDVTGCQQDG